LWRWQRDPKLNFPQPTVVNKYAYTDLNAVDAWMRARVVDRTVVKASKTSRKRAEQGEQRDGDDGVNRGDA
jgi:hypothetical protein